MKPNIIKPEEINKKIGFVHISTFDWSEFTELGTYPYSLKPKLRKSNDDSVSQEVIDMIKKDLKS